MSNYTCFCTKLPVNSKAYGISCLISTAMDQDVCDSDQITGALTVFSLASPFHDSLQSDFRLFSLFSRSIRMQQQWTPDGKGGTEIGFGASVYNCSIVLATYLEMNPWVVTDRICVELGCGPGLVSVAAALAGKLTNFNDWKLDTWKTNCMLYFQCIRSENGSCYGWGQHFGTTCINQFAE